MQELKNSINILFYIGMLLFIIYMAVDFILVDLENGSYDILIIVILVLILGWANDWNFGGDLKPPKE